MEYRPDPRLNEFLFDGKTRHRVARVHVQFVEDGTHMRIDRMQADDELFGDLGIRHALSNQA